MDRPSLRSRNLPRTIVAALASALAACGGVEPATDPSSGEAVGRSEEALVGRNTCISSTIFSHVATPTNRIAHYTRLDHPSVNGQPSALIIVTPNWSPAGIKYVPNYHPIGVWYDKSAGRWNIYNEDGAPIPDGTGFTVRVGPGWTARTPAPATGAATHLIGLFLATRNFVTPSYNPGGGAPGNNDTSPLALSYGPVESYLVHTDGLPFNPSSYFNLAHEDCATHAVTGPANVVGADFIVDDPRANGNPRALVLASRFSSLGDADASGPAPGHLAAHYDAGRARWLLRGWSKAGEAMALRAGLEILVQTP